MNADEFRKCLVDQTPSFDAIFLKDYNPEAPFLMPLRVDVRLLPNNLRKKWLQSKGYLSLGKTRKQRRKRFRFLRRIGIDEVMKNRLNKWLKSLSPIRRRREVRIRTHRGHGFVGKFTTGKWNSGSDEIFTDIVKNHPDLNDKWIP